MRDLTASRAALVLRVHPCVRVYCTIILLVAAMLAPSPQRLIATGAIIAALAVLSGVGWRRAAWGAVPVASLVGGVAILSAMSGMRSSEFQLGRVAIFAGRCYLAYLATASLLASTHYSETIRSLDAIRVPALFTAVAGSICRWFYVVSSEVTSANTARVLRGGDCKGRVAQAGDLARLSASMMARSFLRAERVAAAMECRGFCGRLVRLPGVPLRARDLAVLPALVAGIAGIWAALP
ncbi:MAG: energy-coupling factor transporter transmembrane component T family protein [Armatimonadota bacterium]